MASAEQAGEGDGAKVKRAHEAGQALEICDALRGCYQTADHHPEQDDLIVQRNGAEIFEAGQVGGSELAGVETVLEGIFIAARGAATARGGGGVGRGHRIFHHGDTENTERDKYRDAKILSTSIGSMTRQIIEQ